MKTIGLVLILIIALAADAVTGMSAVVSQPSPNPLGIWNNFPCGAVDCGTPQQTGVGCSVGGRLDTCELMNSTAYRGVIYVPSSTDGMIVQFEVGCVTPATPTPAGSVVYLQYANYSLTTYLNTSNFQTSVTAGSIYIDNTNGWPCPGTLVSSAGGLHLPAVIQDGTKGFEFRVIGVCSPCPNGGNAGAPRLSFVRLLFQQNIQRVFTTAIATRATTNFKWEGITTLSGTAATTVSITWIATNQTSVTCGVADTCVQSGTSSCVIAIGSTQCSLTTVTFTNAFVGTPAVSADVSNPPVIAIIDTGGLSLFEAGK